MAPKFIIDINVPDTSAEDQMAACQRILEERLEDFSATPLTVEPLEGEDNVGVDTRVIDPKAVEEEEEEPKPAPKAPKIGNRKQLEELHVMVLRTKEGVEGIATLKGQPIVFSDKVKFETAKKLLKSQLVADPAPAGMKFFHMLFVPAQHAILGEVK